MYNTPSVSIIKYTLKNIVILIFIYKFIVNLISNLLIYGIVLNLILLKMMSVKSIANILKY